MEKRIELEKRGSTADQITDLNLDNCRSTCIDGLTDDFVNLKTLSMNSAGLTSLKGFPKLPNLTRLELSDNRISSGLNLLSTSPNLTYLNLSGNKIKDLDTLKPLEDFQHLRTLDLFHNEVTRVDNYREKIFKLIPSLKYLDGFDMKEEQEESDAGETDVIGVYPAVNGVDEDDDDDTDEFDEFDDEEEGVEEEELGLDAVYKDNLDEESEGEDYLFGSEEEDEDIPEEEESSVQETDEDATPRGKKRKHEGEEEVN